MITLNNVATMYLSKEERNDAYYCATIRERFECPRTSYEDYTIHGPRNIEKGVLAGCYDSISSIASWMQQNVYTYPVRVFLPINNVMDTL